MHVRLYDITVISLISNLHGKIGDNGPAKIYPGNDDLYSSLSINLIRNDGKSIFKVYYMFEQ